jgi:predicted transposase/invertase (TIGR01784 family)
MGEKRCRLDINMTVNGQRVDLEIQVTDEGDYPERSLYYWAREYSSALGEGEQYIELPRTIIISIVAFPMFGCAEFHSEFHALEVTRHTQLTDKFCMHYFELSKLPKSVSRDDELKLWLSLFKAETEEELKELEAMEVPEMNQAIEAYHQVTATDEFKYIERMRRDALNIHASAIGHARREERKIWEGVIADRDSLIADRDNVIADRDNEIDHLKKQLTALQKIIQN